MIVVCLNIATMIGEITMAATDFISNPENISVTTKGIYSINKYLGAFNYLYFFLPVYEQLEMN